jgi:hypothetical protein
VSAVSEAAALLSRRFSTGRAMARRLAQPSNHWIGLRKSKKNYKVNIIPGSRQNPKMLWVYDTKVVRDRIAKFLPVFWDILAQEGERLVGEFPECGVTLVARHMLVHRAP